MSAAQGPKPAVPTPSTPRADRKYEVISADGHVEVPWEMFSDRIPKRFAEYTPHLVEAEEGAEMWQMKNFRQENHLLCRLDYDEFLPATGRRYHLPDGTLRPGCGDGAQRLREQDEDGIDAEVLYPSPIVPGFLKKIAPENKEAYLSIIRAYNDFLAEDYCSVAPDRLIGTALMPETGVEDALAEMTRARRKGLACIAPSAWPNGGMLNKPEDDRFFAAALALDMKLAPHQNFGGVEPRGESRAVTKSRTFDAFFRAGGPAPIGQLIANGVFDRFPDIRFYFAETNAGWLPYALDQADEWYQRWSTYFEVRLRQLPSQYVREHCRFSFISDRVAITNRYLIGIDLLMWGSDFPHSISTTPHSRAFLDEVFDGVPANERRRILVDNVCDFFGLDAARALTPTP